MAWKLIVFQLKKLFKQLAYSPLLSVEINEVYLNWTDKTKEISVLRSKLQVLDSVTGIEYSNGNIMLFLTTDFDFFFDLDGIKLYSDSQRHYGSNCTGVLK